MSLPEASVMNAARRSFGSSSTCCNNCFVRTHLSEVIQTYNSIVALPSEVTQLLEQYRGGDKQALDKVLPIVYDELRQLARLYINRERAGHTLQPTALVHEAYMRLVGQFNVDWRNRGQFMGVAAKMMRRVLLNYAEARNAAKRDDGTAAFELPNIIDSKPIDVVALDIALDKLKEIDPLQERLVELRFFAGLNAEEAAEVLELSTATINREWAVAKLWLRRELA